MRRGRWHQREAVLVITAWMALFCMWGGAGVTDFLVYRKADELKISCEAVRNESGVAA